MFVIVGAQLLMVYLCFINIKLRDYFNCLLAIIIC